MKYILGRHWWPDLHITAEPLKFLMMDSKPFVSDDVSMRKLETETLARLSGLLLMSHSPIGSRSLPCGV